MSTAKYIGLGVVSAAASASGAIVVFDTNGASFDANADDGYGERIIFSGINLNDGTFTTTKSFVASSFPTVDNPFFSIRADVEYGDFVVNGSLTLNFLNTAGANLLLLNPGDVISSTPGFVNSGFNSYSSGNTSEIPTGTHYIGLRLQISDNSDLRYGWAEFSTSGDDVYTVSRFAFNDVPNESILAGQTTAVPEASTLGFVGGVFGLVALAHARRRKAKQAAASEKFLALAAGEKLN
jgi:hypothetical protein